MLNQLPIFIETCAPVVFSTKTGDAALTATKDFFPGGVVRGALAQRMIRRLNLGANAHLNADFMRLCLSGALRFLPAYPRCGAATAMVLPLSIYKNKEGNQFADLLFDRDYKVGFKAAKGFGLLRGHKDGTYIESVSVARDIQFHSARSSDENHEVDRIAGKSVDGKIFNYESIRAGQVFGGCILGQQADLSRLQDQLEISAEGFTAYFGRSKYTQYGKCHVRFGEQEAVEALPDALPQDTLYLRCATPFLPYKATVRTDCALQEIIDDLRRHTGSEFSLVTESIYAGWEEIDQFVAVWGMRRPRELALSAGSVFGIKKVGQWTKTDVVALNGCLYGACAKRREEGFGQFRIWQRQTLETPPQAQEQAAVSPPLLAVEVKRVTQEIIMRYVLAKMREFAKQDVDRVKDSLDGKKHMFVRLENMLAVLKKDNINLKTAFQAKLKDEIGQHSAANQHLQVIPMQGKTLWEVLIGEANMPYETRLDWREQLPKELPKLAEEIDMSLPDKDNGAIFYEYCLWFFRYARKAASRREQK